MAEQQMAGERLSESELLLKEAQAAYFQANHDACLAALYVIVDTAEGWAGIEMDESDQDMCGTRVPVAMVDMFGGREHYGETDEVDTLLDKAGETLMWLDDHNHGTWGAFIHERNEPTDPWTLDFTAIRRHRAEMDQARAEAEAATTEEVVQ